MLAKSTEKLLGNTTIHTGLLTSWTPPQYADMILEVDNYSVL